MSNLLALLKRLEWPCVYDRYGDRQSECLECGNVSSIGHDKGCELKAMIDKLEEEHAKKLNNDIDEALKQCGFRKA